MMYMLLMSVYGMNIMITGTYQVYLSDVFITSFFLKAITSYALFIMSVGLFQEFVFKKKSNDQIYNIPISSNNFVHSMLFMHKNTNI